MQFPPNTLFSQAPVTPPGSTFSYSVYSQQTYNYFNSIPYDSSEASPLNTFRRIDITIAPKITGHDDINVLTKVLGPITCAPNSITDKYWREIGPNRSSATNPNDNVNGTGPTSFITFDPDDPNLLFTGSWVSGLFYSEDYGTSWKKCRNR